VYWWPDDSGPDRWALWAVLLVIGMVAVLARGSPREPPQWLLPSILLLLAAAVYYLLPWLDWW
jgi:hypothetical protein